MSGTLLCLFIILCGLVRAQRGLEVATQREQSTSSSGGRNTENMTINWKTNYVSDLKSVDVYSSFISCIHCLQIQTLWRFYRDSTPYVKSSSWWVTDVLPWTWPARRRKVGLTIHLTAATPKVSYCGFMIAFSKTRPFVIFFSSQFSKRFSHSQNSLCSRSTCSRVRMVLTESHRLQLHGKFALVDVPNFKTGRSSIFKLKHLQLH